VLEYFTKIAVLYPCDLNCRVMVFLSSLPTEAFMKAEMVIALAKLARLI